MTRLLRRAACAGYAAFLVDAFGIQPARRRRVSGSAGWRKPCSRVDLVGEVLWMAGLAGTAVAPLVRRRTDPGPLQSVLGLGMVGAGIGVAQVAQHQLGEGWKPSADAAGDVDLVTSGLFDHVRNPFYLGCALSSVGMALVAPGVVSWTAAGSVVVAAELVVRLVEEPQLRQAHGPAYERYARRTGRFLPPLRRPSSGAGWRPGRRGW